MTPAERAVLDAARALEPVLGEVADRGYVDETGVMRSYSGNPDKLREVVPAFLAAVRALPRPLSEQLAELRPGAVVTSGHSETPRLVVVNDVEAQKLWLRDAHRADQQPEPRMYRDIRRVISNPEADRG